MHVLHHYIKRLKAGNSAASTANMALFLSTKYVRHNRSGTKSCLHSKWEVSDHRPQQIPSISPPKSIMWACTFTRSKWKLQEIRPPPTSARLFHCNQCCASDMESILIAKPLPGISICMRRKARSISSQSILSWPPQKTTHVEMQG